ncbi:quinone oxidoreductase family protein [Timonella sp. A28]|uniref:quinone oxidoreductase family protein n=1 Tax=Timonella sp. A28 TaxID=3442640 RepID=UPI003EBE4484
MTTSKTPYAIIAPRPGDHTILRRQAITVPSPKPHELVVKISAAGVNFIDTYLRSGVYTTTYPHVIGTEGAGVVQKVGSEATHFSVGDRVTWTAAPGSYATHVAVPAANAVRIPDSVDTQTAAALPLQGLTAHYLATSSYPLTPGDIALIHAGAGGVGLLLTHIAQLLGAHVISTVSTANKAELSKQAGADHVIRYDQYDDIATELPLAVRKHAADIRAIHGHSYDDGRGEGVSVVYDGVGHSTFEASLASLRTRGTLVLFGGSSGQVDPFNLQRLNSGGSLTITRPSLTHFLLTRQELESRMNDLYAWHAQGKLPITVGATYPLEQASLAHQALESRATSGKILLIP